MYNFRGDELATVWQQWPQSDDLDMLFCAREGGHVREREGW